MRAALIGLALAAAAIPARGEGDAAAVPLALAERQVVTLAFDRAVARVAVTDPDLLAIRARGVRVELRGVRGGRGSLEIAFEDGATVAYDVTVVAARRPPPPGESAPGALELRPGDERRIPAPGVARVLVEENGVARVRVEGGEVVVVAVSPGLASLVLVDGAGGRTTWSVRVR